MSVSRLARISFTGLVTPAKLVAQAAAANLVPCSLKMGEKLAFDVLGDGSDESDKALDQAAANAALMHRNAGQVCLASTRLLAHASVADSFVQRLKFQADNLKVDDSREPNTEIVRRIHPRQVERVHALCNARWRSGATLPWSGSAHDFGAQLHHQPTLLLGVQQTDEIEQAEVFGQALTLQTFETDAECIAFGKRHRPGPGPGPERGFATARSSTPLKLRWLNARVSFGSTASVFRFGRAVWWHQAQRSGPRGWRLELRFLLRRARCNRPQAAF